MLKKITKRILKIILWIVVAFIALDLLIVTLLFVPPVQHFVLSKVSNVLTDITGGSITMDRIYLSPFFVLTAKNLAIRDHHHQNMIFATTLKGRINFTKTDKGQVTLSFAELDDGEVVLRRYAGEDSVNISLWVEGLKRKEERDPTLKLLFQNIALNNMRFVYINDDKRLHKDDNTIDYAFFELKNIYFNVDDFLVFGADISCQINSLTFSQYTGFEISSFKGDFRINRQGLTIGDLYFTTPNSVFSGDFAFRYDDFSDYSDFVNRINFDTEVKSASLAMQDVIYFAPTLKGMDNQFIFSGHVGGTINHLQTTNLYLKYKLQTNITGNFAIENIRDFKNSFFDLSVKDARLNFAELEQFKLPGGKTLQLPEVAKKLTYSRISGNYKGSLTEFYTNLSVQTNLGAAELSMSATPRESILLYSGNIACSNLNLGELLNQHRYLNKINLRSSIEGSATNTASIRDMFASISVRMQGKVTHIDIFNYPLKDVNFNGNYAHKQLNLALHSTDSVALFHAKGNVNLAREVPAISAALTQADLKLYELFSHFPHQEHPSSGSFVERLIHKIQQTPDLALDLDSITIAMSGTQFENLNGYIGIDHAQLTNGEKTSRIDWFRLIAINQPDALHQYQIHSNAFNVSFKTNYDLKSLIATGKNAAYYYIPDMLDRNHRFVAAKDVPFSDSTQFADMNVQFYYTRNLFDLILPQLNISPNSSIAIHLGRTRMQDSVNLSFSQISYAGIGKVNNLKVTGKLNEQWLAIQLQSDSISIFQKRGGSLTFSNIGVSTNSNRKEVNFETSWRNPKGISINGLNKFNGLLWEGDSQSISLNITDSRLLLRESLWQFTGDGNTISFGNNRYLFDHCVLSSDVGRISVNGEISKESNKECNILLENFDISLVNPLVSRTSMSFGGEMSLVATITPNIDHFIVDGRTFVKDFVFNEELFGDLFLSAKMLNDGEPHFYGGILSSNDSLNVNFSEFFHSDYLSLPNKIIALNGRWIHRERELRVHADMDTLRIGFLSPFLASFSNLVSGEASGHLDFIMNRDSLYFDGKVLIKNAKLGITPLNTIYYLTNQEIMFNREGIIFNRVMLKDKFNNDATLSGFVHHNRFKDFIIDLNISTPRIMVLNTPRQIDAPFFGDGFVSGDVSIRGDTKQLNFTSRNIKTLPGSIITFPLNSTSSVSAAQGIYFIQNTANREVPVSNISQTNTILNFDFTFDVTRDADVKLDVDAIDGTLRCKTSGRLHLTYNTNSGSMNIDGILSIVSGTFSMSLRNFFPRNFSIVEGGTISFSGPLTAAQLNVSALYQKAAMLTPISPDLRDIGRTDVQALLGLTGNLMNPNPSFAFNFPRLTDSEQMLVFSRLDTANEQNGVRQFFSFVFLNTFMSAASLNAAQQSVETGIDMVSGILTSFISNQLNNVSIGLNFINDQGGELGHYTEYSVNAAVNLYNNKLILRTNLGYAESSSQQNNNNFVGDFDLEYWINENWRLRVFYFNDINTSQDAVRPPQGGGVGISYRHEFDNRKDFVESWTPKKKKKRD